MISTILSEDFEVTPAIRAHVDKNMTEINHFVPFIEDDVPVRFFLKQDGARLFCVTISAHFWGREFVGTHKDPNLYQAITLAKRHLVRQLNHVKGRRTAMKRKTPRASEIADLT